MRVDTPLTVSLHHDRVQGLLGPPAGLEQGGEVAAAGELGNLELDGAYPGVPRPRAVAVAIGGSLTAALVRQGPNLGRDLGLHQGLGQHLHALFQDVGVIFLEKLAYEGSDVHPGLGHCHLLI